MLLFDNYLGRALVSLLRLRKFRTSPRLRVDLYCIKRSTVLPCSRASIEKLPLGQTEDKYWSNNVLRRTVECATTYFFHSEITWRTVQRPFRKILRQNAKVQRLLQCRRFAVETFFKKEVANSLSLSACLRLSFIGTKPCEKCGILIIT